MNIIQRRNEEADAFLASLSEQQLRDGLKRGVEMLTMLQADQCIAEQDIHDRIGHPSQHPTKRHVAYMQSDFDWKSRHLNSAIADCRAELARRGIDASVPA